MTDGLYEEIVRLQREGRDCALCTIVSTQGSTPGKEMMKLLVRDDGSFAGTVGGGCLEAEVLEAALASLRDERSRMLEFALNERDWPDSGLVCGGRVQVYVEPITEPKLYLFGGGHVSAAIARIARPCGFHVTVGDDRAEFATRGRHPDAQALVGNPFEEQARALAPARRTFVVVCTRGHDEDGTILEALWRHGAAPRYLGMIGSRAKRATLFEKLRSRGVPQAFLDSVRSPMGLPIGARNHAEIAVSVVAEMIQVRRAADARGPIDPTQCR
jgi:xanthine dehydrogenase accessory factor